MDLDRFADDAPADDADADDRVCVVATQPDTFARCRDGIYPSPLSYERSRADFDRMAFYRTAPISAVTHHAAVTGRVRQRRGEDGPLTEHDWATLLDPFTDEREVVVFEFGPLVPLDRPVQNDQNGVRGAWYCDVADLRAVDRLSALAGRAER
ncbi:MAG: hypothetical protein A07HB70_02511 [uncultured archaeon A07HB70]|nr:MAG: hypothetical protein A07HB70_02511 [uncultured archaeon A07HB70]